LVGSWPVGCQRRSEPMLAVVYTSLFVIVPTVALWFQHAQRFGVMSWTYVLLSLFCVINSMIAVWEIALFMFNPWISKSFRALQKKIEKGSVPPIFMFQQVPLREALSLRYWANVWLAYTWFDESYSDPKSYGFWIDTGNGFSTLLPSIVFALGMTFDILSARHLGILGLLQFYQEFYGTVLYFWSFIHNRRWEDHGWTGQGLVGVLAVVVLSNGLWFAGPALGFYVSYGLITEGDPALARLRS